MTAPQVQKVKAAVAKRRGDAAPVPGAVPSGRSRGGGRRRTRREKARRSPVDQQTLLMGGGFGVVFVGVLITICYLYLVGGGSEVSSGGSKPTVAEERSPGSGIGIPRPEDRVPSIAADIEKELPRGIVNEIHNLLSDIQRDLIDSPPRARVSLQTLKTSLEERRNQGYTIPEDVQARLSEVEEGLKVMEATEAAPLLEETPRTPEKEPPPAEKEETATPDAADKADAADKVKDDAGDGDDLDPLDDLNLDDFNLDDF